MHLSQTKIMTKTTAMIPTSTQKGHKSLYSLCQGTVTFIPKIPEIKVRGKNIVAMAANKFMDWFILFSNLVIPCSTCAWNISLLSSNCTLILFKIASCSLNLSIIYCIWFPNSRENKYAFNFYFSYLSGYEFSTICYIINFLSFSVCNRWLNRLYDNPSANTNSDLSQGELLLLIVAEMSSEYEHSVRLS